MIGEVVGNFRIVSKIGEGGMGVVYLAEHVDVPTVRCAIKSLSDTLSTDPLFHERFRQEIDNQAKLGSHANVVRVTDVVERRGRIFLLMDYVEGPDLGKWIKSKGKLSQKEALGLFRGILAGMAHAHSKGIIHRDIKPANILIEQGRSARINDFGLAILAGAREQRHTVTGAAVGSPCYMSPEQITRPHEVDHRSDIYSLGVVLYEMLTGEVPFDGDTAFAIQQQQVHTPAPDPRKRNSTISPELARIIQTAMAKEPRARFPHCLDFLRAIEAVDDTSRPRLPYTLLGVTSALVVLWFFMSPPSPPPMPPVIPASGNGSNTAISHRLAAGAIDTGAKGVWILCTQLKQIEAKKDGPAVAKLIGDTNAEEQLSRQLQELRRNVEEVLLPEHTDSLRRLAEVGDDVVAEAFDDYARTLTDKEAFGRIRGARILKDHYQQFRKDQKRVSLDAVKDACVRGLD
jgi:serine/threonine protein kinase